MTTMVVVEIKLIVLAYLSRLQYNIFSDLKYQKVQCVYFEYYEITGMNTWRKHSAHMLCSI